MRERLGDDSVDCVITDPPYGIDYDASMHVGIEGGENYNQSIEGDEIEDTVALWRDFLNEVRRVLKPDGHVYTFTPLKELPRLQPIVEGALSLENKIVWVKNNHTISPDSGGNYGYKYEEILYSSNPDSTPRPLSKFSTNVVEFDRPTSGEYNHPTQKPVPLVSFLLEQSTREGDTVLDPFMGSGTTAVAAIQNDREYVGFEIDEDNYRGVIERRIGEAKRQRDATVNTDA
jgi:site-specific DNA-methyltransferase (adenine-specific)